MEMTELESVKQIAKNMNITVGNIKDVAKIKELIAEKQAPVIPLTMKQQERKRFAAVRKEAMALTRIRLSPMSPFERQLPNTLVDVGNKAVGQVKRVIPFNEVWHVEKIVLDALRARKFRSKKERVDPQTRRKIYENVFSASYGIEVLPDLTPTELKELAQDQKARSAID